MINLIEWEASWGCFCLHHLLRVFSWVCLRWLFTSCRLESKVWVSVDRVSIDCQSCQLFLPTFHCSHPSSVFLPPPPRHHLPFLPTLQPSLAQTSIDKADIIAETRLFWNIVTHFQIELNEPLLPFLVLRSCQQTSCLFPLLLTSDAPSCNVSSVMTP